LWAATAWAEEAATEAAAAAPKLDTGDTAWMLTSSALVLMMTIPGLALFYGGLVRTKNVLSTLMPQLLLRHADQRHLGALRLFPRLRARRERNHRRQLALRHGGHPRPTNALAPTIPQMLFVATGDLRHHHAGADLGHLRRAHEVQRLRALHAALVDAPLQSVAHWVWGGGWIASQVGALDFAGGTVVHISSGVSALVTALYLGKRLGYPSSRWRRTTYPSR